MKRIVVVLGAGASHDCVSKKATRVREEYLPPLVNDLFRHNDAFGTLLRKYPGAEALSDEIRVKILNGATLESLLLEFQGVGDLDTKRQYWQVPLYLQELFGEISSHYVASGVTKYHTLVNRLHRAGFEVLYVTVNYDLLLDNAIKQTQHRRFVSMQDYIQPALGFSLLKLHGSVDWGRTIFVPEVARGIRNSAELVSNLAALEYGAVRRVSVLPGYNDDARFQAGKFYYPAMALPLGGEKEFQCTDLHMEFLCRFFCEASDFLFIGFSGKDQSVTKLFAMVQKLDSWRIVTHTKPEKRVDDAQYLRRELSENALAFVKSEVSLEKIAYRQGFRSFVEDSNGLEKWISEIR